MKAVLTKSVLTFAIAMASACFAILTNGCVSVPTYKIAVDTFSAGSNTNRSYILLPATNTLSAADLQFQEFAAHTHRALHQQGFKQARDAESADIAVFLAFGISGPSVNQYTYSTPIQGQVGTSTSYSSELQPHEEPIYGTVAYQQHVGTYTTFTRHISLEAIELGTQRMPQASRQVWKTTVLSIGSSSDLRRVFPVMLAAAAPYLGVNTGHQIEVTMKEDDPRITNFGIGLQSDSAARPRAP